MRGGWIVLGLLVTGLVIAGGAMIAERPATPGKPMAGGGGSFTPSPPASTTPATAPPIAGGQISVAGIDQDEAYACDAGVVSISGVHNRVVLSGHCTRVDVSGVRNTVIIEESDTIVVSGLDNDVTFRLGSPEVDQSGFDNRVARG